MLPARSLLQASRAPAARHGPAAWRVTVGVSSLSPAGLVRVFSSNSPRSRVELHRSQAARLRAPKRHSKEERTNVPLSEVIQAEAEHQTEGRPSDEPSARTLTVEGTVVSSQATPAVGVGGVGLPSSVDAQGRHEIRTKMHPDGAIVGRGRVVANFGTRMLVQEVPWDESQERHQATHPNTNTPAAEVTAASPVEGTRFSCMPRGKLGKIVCGDTVLWEWSDNHADSSAFVVEVLPRQTEFRRVDKNGKHGTGRDEVLLASNFHHICIVCAPQPATNGMLIDRYLAAATQMGVSASIIFNKIDLEHEAERFRPDMDDFRQIGVKVFETSCAPGKEKGIDELKKHLATTGPNGAPGITIFVGQSGSGKSSLLNSLSPSLELTTNELSKNAQGRHTTTQTILHQLESGGEIIDSPGFQNYIPAALPLRQVAAGFQDCHFGSRCLHLTEPDCGVRMAVRGSAADAVIAEQQTLAAAHAVPPPLMDPRAAIVAAYQNALLAGADPLEGGVLPDDPDSPLNESRNSASTRWRKREWENKTRRQRQADIDHVAVTNLQVKTEVMAEPPADTGAGAVAVDLSPRTRQIAEQLLERGLQGTISKRRYESYLALVGQQQEIEKHKYQ